MLVSNGLTSPPWLSSWKRRFGLPGAGGQPVKPSGSVMSLLTRSFKKWV